MIFMRSGSWVARMSVFGAFILSICLGPGFAVADEIVAAPGGASRAYLGMTAAETLAVLNDTSLPDDERIKPFSYLLNLPVEEQRQTLEAAAFIDNERIRMMANAMLIVHFGAQETPFILKNLHRWSVNEQTVAIISLVDACERTSDRAGLEPIARRLMWNARKVDPKKQSRAIMVWDIAAVCLRSAEGAKENKAALHNYAHLYPNSAAAWRGLGRYKDLCPVEMDAFDKMQDNKDGIDDLGWWLLIAGSSNLKSSEQATHRELGRIVKAYGSTTKSSEIGRAVYKFQSGSLTSAFQGFGDDGEEYMRSITWLAGLRDLQTYPAKVHTMSLISAADPAIRLMACLVAADRWPTELIARLSKTRNGPAEYNKLLALVTMKHPKLRPRVLMSIANSTLDRTIGEINRDTFLRSFGMVGVVYAGISEGSVG